MTDNVKLNLDLILGLISGFDDVDDAITVLRAAGYEDIDSSGAPIEYGFRGFVEFLRRISLFSHAYFEDDGDGLYSSVKYSAQDRVEDYVITDGIEDEQRLMAVLSEYIDNFASDADCAAQDIYATLKVGTPVFVTAIGGDYAYGVGRKAWGGDTWFKLPRECVAKMGE